MRAFIGAGAAPARRAWTVEESAVFAARRDFELLVLLSSHKKAFATARRLGLGRAECTFSPACCWRPAALAQSRQRDWRIGYNP